MGTDNDVMTRVDIFSFLFTHPLLLPLPLHSFHLPPRITTLLVALLFLLSGLFCLASMAFETSGFSNIAIPDGTILTGDLLRTPNTFQSHMLNQNASLLLDRTHDIHTSADSSPLVCDSIICATELYGRFFSV